MKKIVSVLFAVLMMSAASAQVAKFGLRQNTSNLVKSRTHQTTVAATHASKATYNVTAVDFQLQFYEATATTDANWYFGFADANNNKFFFNIYAEDVVPDVTYTFSDMDDYYSYAEINGVEHDLTNASFTYTVVDDIMTINAMAVLDNGDVYNITYSESVSGEYDVTAVDFQVQFYEATATSDANWYFGLADADGNKFYFDIYTDEIVPGVTYTFADMDDYYSYADLNGDEHDLTDASFTYSVNGDVETINARAVLDNGSVYNITYSVSASGEYNVTAVDFQVQFYEATATSDANWYFGLADADGNKFYFDIYTDEIVPGVTYTFADMDDYYSYADLNGDEHDLTDASFTYSVAGNVETINARAVLDNGDVYNITYTYTPPVAEDTIEVVCAGSASFRDYSSQDGAYVFMGFTSDSTLGAVVNYFSSSIEGSYTIADCDAEYTTVFVNFESVSVYDANITVTATAAGYNIEAYLLCEDNHCYHVTMNYVELGINNANKVAVNVYPNPATNVLHIEADGISRVEMIDVAGRVVFSQAQSVNTLNIGSLANGIYMLRTTTNKGVNVQRIVKK